MGKERRLGSDSPRSLPQARLAVHLGQRRVNWVTSWRY